MTAAPIDLERVQAELEQARARAGTPTATTMNLIVYIDEDAVSDRVLERVQTVAAKYPARVLILNSNNEPSADVNSDLKKVGDVETVEAERISIGIAHLSPQAVVSYIRAFSIPNIENVLWWTSATVENEMLFHDVIADMDTIIVDSSGIDSADFAIGELTEFFAEGKRLLIRDLAYMRLAPWQDLVAQFFDDAQFRNDLDTLSRVEVEAGSNAEAFYLVGWLAGRLGWTPCGRYALCDKDGRSIEVSVKRQGEPRRIRRVTLCSPQRSFTAELAQEDNVCLTISDRAESRCAPLHYLDSVTLLEKAFLFTSRDEVFEEALGVLYELLKFTQ